MSGRGLAELQALVARRCIPLTVHLELTSRCNARCVHCFVDPAAVRPRGELGEGEWRAVVDGARAAGALVVTLSGGEAMVSPHFWAVAEHARRIGLAIRVFTNGLLLGRAAVARLAALRPLGVEVSIFSLRPAVHDAVTRVRGSLSRAIRGLFRLKRAGVPLVLKCPLLAGSADDHAAVRRLAARLGAGVVFDPTVFPAADGGDGPTRCRGEDDALVRYFSDAGTLAYDRPRTAPTPAAAAPCGMARSFLVVSAEGGRAPVPGAAAPRRERARGDDRGAVARADDGAAAGPPVRGAPHLRDLPPQRLLRPLQRRRAPRGRRPRRPERPRLPRRRAAGARLGAARPGGRAGGARPEATPARGRRGLRALSRIRARGPSRSRNGAQPVRRADAVSSPVGAPTSRGDASGPLRRGRRGGIA